MMVSFGKPVAEPSSDAIQAPPYFEFSTLFHGSLWIGTDEGLASWKYGKLSQYPELAPEGRRCDW